MKGYPMSGYAVGILIVVLIGGTLFLNSLIRGRTAQPAPDPAQNPPGAPAPGVATPAAVPATGNTTFSGRIHKYRVVLLIGVAGFAYALMMEDFFLLVTIATIIVAGFTLKLLFDTPPTSWQFAFVVAILLAFAQWAPTQKLITKGADWYSNCVADNKCTSGGQNSSNTTTTPVASTPLIVLAASVKIPSCSTGWSAVIDTPAGYGYSWGWAVVAQYSENGSSFFAHAAGTSPDADMFQFCAKKGSAYVGREMPLTWRKL